MKPNDIIRSLMSPQGMPFIEHAGMREMEQALARSKRAFLGVVEQICLPETPCTWGKVFEPLERAWGCLQTVKNCLTAVAYLRGAEFKQLDTAWDIALAELLWELAEKRPLNKKLRQLRAHARLKDWQIKALTESTWLEQLSWEKVRVRDAKKKIEKENESLCALFERNLKAGFEASPLWVDVQSEAARDFPPWLVALGKARAASLGWEGYGAFTPSSMEYSCFMAYCHDRDLRQKMYRARAQGASEKLGQGEWDNSIIARKILSVRKREAKLRGFDSFAKLTLSWHMLDESEKVEAFLLDLASGALPHASKQREDLGNFMREHFGIKRLEPWDYRYARKQLEANLFDGAEHEAMEYFEAQGAIARSVEYLASKLGLECVQERGSEEPCLQVYAFRDQGALIGHIGVAPFALEAGGTSDSCAFEWDLRSPVIGREETAASMVFAQVGRAPDGRERMTHNEIIALFHELGHAFHAILTRVESPSLGAGAMPWDAIEAHSQLFESFAWDPEAIAYVGKKRGKSMPKRLISRLRSRKNFHSHAELIAQITDSLADLRLHSHYKPQGREEPWEVLQVVRKELGLDAPKSYNRHANQLRALGGAYACADYAYLWSEALAHVMRRQLELDSGGGTPSVSAMRRLVKETIAPGASRDTWDSLKSYTAFTPNAGWVLANRGHCASSRNS